MTTASPYGDPPPCPVCGQYHPNGYTCISYPQFTPIFPPIAPIGWQCPVCGRGNAPTTATCPCIQTKTVAATTVVPHHYEAPHVNIPDTPFDNYHPDLGLP